MTDSVATMAGAIHAFARIQQFYEPADQIVAVRFEPCARCGAYHQLVKVEAGRAVRWMQPDHECGGDYHELVTQK